MIKIYTLILVAFTFSCKSQSLGILDTEKYKIAYNTLIHDPVLINYYRQDTLKIVVFKEFHYYNSLRFIDSLKRNNIFSDKEMKSLINSEKKAEKESRFNGYMAMPNEFYQSFDSTTNPLLIIRFDRMRGNFISAEVTNYFETKNWTEGISFKKSWLILFEIRDDEIFFYKTLVIR